MAKDIEAYTTYCIRVCTGRIRHNDSGELKLRARSDSPIRCYNVPAKDLHCSMNWAMVDGARQSGGWSGTCYGVC